MKIAPYKSWDQMGGIYFIKFKPTGMHYLGQTISIKNRIRRHINDLKRNEHCNDKLQRYFNKYGEGAFEFGVLEYCESGQLNEKEIHWINFLNSVEAGFNLVYGGNQNKIVSNETRIKISNSLKGKYTGINHPMYGRTHSEVYKRILSERMKDNKVALGNKLSNITKDKMRESRLETKNHFYGKHHSLETKLKLSIANKGRIPSKETLIKISNSLKGKYIGENHSQCILSEDAAKNIKMRLSNGEKRGNILKDYPVKRSHIDSIFYLRTWIWLLPEVNNKLIALNKNKILKEAA